MDRDLLGVVLDVDGTLVDSERDGHRVAFNQAFDELGLPYHWDPEQYGELLLVAGGERRLATFLEREGVPEPERGQLTRRLHARKTDLFQRLIEDGAVRPRPGVAELLDELADEGVPLCVATTGTRAWVEPLLERLFGIGRFAAVVTGDEAPVRKPDPSAHHQAVDALGLPPGPGVVALEDSRNGLVAAKGAGLSCIVVVNGYTRDQDFTEAELVLAGFGGDEPPTALRDPLGAAPRDRLDVSTLRRVAALAPGDASSP